MVRSTKGPQSSLLQGQRGKAVLERIQNSKRSPISQGPGPRVSLGTLTLQISLRLCEGL